MVEEIILAVDLVVLVAVVLVEELQHFRAHVVEHLHVVCRFEHFFARHLRHSLGFRRACFRTRRIYLLHHLRHTHDLLLPLFLDVRNPVPSHVRSRVVLQRDRIPKRKNLSGYPLVRAGYSDLQNMHF